MDLKKFLVWGALGVPDVGGSRTSAITAELEPIEGTYVDEVDMGMTYDELGTYGRLRKIEKLGRYPCLGVAAVDFGGSVRESTGVETSGSRRESEEFSFIIP